jgi:sugar lactone lactonase YvrE
MRLRFGSLIASVLLFALSTSAQLPPDEKLSAADEGEFNKELERLEQLLSTANDKAAIELQIANTYAAGGRYTEAIRRLRKVVAANPGFDPSRDPDLRKLGDTSEFGSIMDEVRRHTPPVHQSRLIATIKLDVRPESIAFDTKRNLLLLGNMARFEIFGCSLAARCVPIVKPDTGEDGYVLGLKIDRAAGVVWAANNTAGGASLRSYDLGTGQVRRTASIKGKHVFNDLVISSTGTVFVSDTAEGSVYQLPSGATALQRVVPQHEFTAANGIAISADESLLYVSTWGDGIDAIDLQSGAVTPMMHPDNICLAFVDGLYATRRSLIAIQNGPMLPRIVVFRLAKNRLQIVAMKVLERRNPAFDGITTGAVVRNDFYYIANPQTDKKRGAELQPLQVFSMRIDR